MYKLFFQKEYSSYGKYKPSFFISIMVEVISEWSLKKKIILI